MKEGVFYLLASAKIYLFSLFLLFWGEWVSSEEQRVGVRKIMGKSGEIKTGNERIGLLCTKTCRNAPNWVLDLKKNKQSALVYTSQVNLLTQHIVWEFKSIIPHESILLTATVLIQGWGGGCFVSQDGKGRQWVPAETVPRQFTSQGDYQRGWSFLLPFANIARTRWVELSHTPRVSPESPLNPCIP